MHDLTDNEICIMYNVKRVKCQRIVQLYINEEPLNGEHFSHDSVPNLEVKSQ